MMADETLTNQFRSEIHEEVKSLEIKLSGLDTNIEILTILSSMIFLYLTSTPGRVLKYWNPSFFILLVIWTIYALLRPQNSQSQKSKTKGTKFSDEARYYYLQTLYGMNFESFFKAFGLLFLVSAYIGLYNVSNSPHIPRGIIILIGLLIVASISLLVYATGDRVADVLEAMIRISNVLNVQSTSQQGQKIKKEHNLSKTGYRIVSILFAIIKIGILAWTATLIFRRVFPGALSEGLWSILWIIQFMAIQYILVFSLATYIQKSKIRKQILNALLSLQDYMSDPQVFQITYGEFMDIIKFTNFRQGTFVFAIDYPLYWPHPRYVRWLSGKHGNDIEKEQKPNNEN